MSLLTNTREPAEAWCHAKIGASGAILLLPKVGHGRQCSGRSTEECGSRRGSRHAAAENAAGQRAKGASEGQHRHARQNGTCAGGLLSTRVLTLLSYSARCEQLLSLI